MKKKSYFLSFLSRSFWAVDFFPVYFLVRLFLILFCRLPHSFFDLSPLVVFYSLISI